ncbi:MAG: hypothetical protein ACOY90_06925 [Candidatus Zhuqueibacterota bacterium]
MTKYEFLDFEQRCFFIMIGWFFQGLKRAEAMHFIPFSHAQSADNGRESLQEKMRDSRTNCQLQRQAQVSVKRDDDRCR